MKILSLFDGMACGMLAMNKAGIPVDRYVAFEIDKYAVKTSSHNFPMIEHRGDVFQADFTEFQGFDFLVGGSPCTYWSIAQKNNRETEASGMGWELFSQYVRALREAQPRWFIYENNKSMSKAIRESITKTFGFEPVCINSALVSAQNRQRLYWVGRRNADGTYSKAHVEQPEDRNTVLRNILDNGKCLSDRELDYMFRKVKDGRNHFDFGHYSDATLAKSHACVATFSKGVPYNVLCEPVGVGYRNRRESDGKLYRRFETHNEPKSNALTTVQTDSMVAIPENDSQSVYEVSNGFITINGRTYKIKLPDGFYLIRKFSVSECKRLQTVPEWYEFPVSDSQAYKMLGNGWTVDVIVHLINATQNTEQTDLFCMVGEAQCSAS